MDAFTGSAGPKINPGQRDAVYIKRLGSGVVIG